LKFLHHLLRSLGGVRPDCSKQCYSSSGLHHISIPWTSRLAKVFQTATSFFCYPCVSFIASRQRLSLIVPCLRSRPVPLVSSDSSVGPA
jgi:hypothetical protein